MKISENTLGILFVLPFILLFIFFVIGPLLEEISLSFYEAKIGTEHKFIGIKNFVILSSSSDYHRALLNTTLYVGIAVNIKLILALLIANYLNKEFKGRAMVEILFLLPWAIPTVSALLNFRWILDTDMGIINQILSTIGLSKVRWLSQYDTAMLSIIVFHIWKWLPFWTVIFLGGIKSIPRELYEACSIDGGGVWKTFRFITLPLIKPLYVICVLLSTIWTIGDFNTVYVLTGGGPAQTTNVLATLAYRYAFFVGDFGIASAIITFILPIVLILLLLLFRMIK
ncbi:MAG: sugar ABC transporter permease [Candidatus Methanomethylicaceae archaeon]